MGQGGGAEGSQEGPGEGSAEPDLLVVEEQEEGPVGLGPTNASSEAGAGDGGAAGAGHHGGGALAGGGGGERPSYSSRAARRKTREQRGGGGNGDEDSEGYEGEGGPVPPRRHRASSPPTPADARGSSRSGSRSRGGGSRRRVNTARRGRGEDDGQRKFSTLALEVALARLQPISQFYFEALPGSAEAPPGMEALHEQSQLAAKRLQLRPRTGSEEEEANHRLAVQALRESMSAIRPPTAPGPSGGFSYIKAVQQQQPAPRGHTAAHYPHVLGDPTGMHGSRMMLVQPEGPDSGFASMGPSSGEVFAPGLVSNLQEPKATSVRRRSMGSNGHSSGSETSSDPAVRFSDSTHNQSMLRPHTSDGPSKAQLGAPAAVYGATFLQRPQTSGGVAPWLPGAAEGRLHNRNQPAGDMKDLWRAQQIGSAMEQSFSYNRSLGSPPRESPELAAERDEEVLAMSDGGGLRGPAEKPREQEKEKPPVRRQPTEKTPYALKLTFENRNDDWRKNRDMIDLGLARTSRYIALFANLGMVLSVLQNELIFQYDEDTGSAAMNVLKAGNSVLTVIALGFLVWYYWLWLLFERIDDHLKKLLPLDLKMSWAPVLRNAHMWIEIAVIAVHLPPTFTMELSYNTMGNIIVHKAETIFCLLNTLRLYLFWRVIKYRVLHSLPKRHTVARFWSVNLQSQFAFKELMNHWTAINYLALFWFLAIFLTGYWYRCVEYSACNLASHTHPKCDDIRSRIWKVDANPEFEAGEEAIYQSALWTMFVTSTTVGYGDTYPTTHAGRFIAALCALIGLVVSSLLIASLSNTLAWTPEERSAMVLIDRERARILLHSKAARLIQLWWLKILSKKTGVWKGMDVMTIRKEFRITKRESTIDIEDCTSDSFKVRPVEPFSRIEKARTHTRERAHTIDIEDCTGDSVKIDRLVKRSKDTKDMVDLLAESLFLPEEMQAVAEKERQRLKINVSEGRVFRHTDGSFAQNAYAQKVRDRINKQLASIRSKEGLEGRDSSRGVNPILHILPFAFEYKTDTWRRQRDQVEQKKLIAIWGCTGASVIGMLCAIVQNELILQDHAPREGGLIICGLLNTLFTGLALLYLVQYYWLNRLFQRVIAHLNHDKPLVSTMSWTDFLFDTNLWVEFLVVAIHLPPGVTFEISYKTQSNIVVHRAETLLCLWNMFRMYNLARVMKEHVLGKMPKRYTVARHSKIRMDSSFAIKTVLNDWSAFVYIGFVWLVSLLVLCYWYRCSEITACLLASGTHPDCDLPEAKMWVMHGSEFEKENVLHIQSAMWFTVVTTTTLGYGDTTPSTHMGRAVSAFTALTGIVFASLLTAALSNALHWTGDERAVVTLLEREKARRQIYLHSVRVIQNWWWRRKGKQRSFFERRRIEKARDRFRELRRNAMLEVEDCADTSAKIDSIAQTARYINDGVMHIAKQVNVALEEGWAPPRDHLSRRKTRLNGKRGKGTFVSRNQGATSSGLGSFADRRNSAASGMDIYKGKTGLSSDRIQARKLKLLSELEKMIMMKEVRNAKHPDGFMRALSGSSAGRWSSSRGSSPQSSTLRL